MHQHDGLENARLSDLVARNKVDWERVNKRREQDAERYRNSPQFRNTQTRKSLNGLIEELKSAMRKELLDIEQKVLLEQQDSVRSFVDQIKRNSVTNI